MDVETVERSDYLFVRDCVGRGSMCGVSVVYQHFVYNGVACHEIITMMNVLRGSGSL